MFIIIPMLLVVSAFSMEMGFQDGQKRPNDASFFRSDKM